MAEGMRFRTIRELPVLALTLWAGPGTGSRPGHLPAGTPFRIARTPPPGAAAATCEPEEPRRLGRTLVPLWERLCIPFYRGYILVIDLKEIREACERLDPPE